MTVDEIMFFDGHPAALPLYEKLKGSILTEIPDTPDRGQKDTDFFPVKAHVCGGVLHAGPESTESAAVFPDGEHRPAPPDRFSTRRCGSRAVSGTLDASRDDRLSRRGGR